MVSDFLKAILVVFAAIVAAVGITVITARSRALDASSYKRAIAPSGIYREARLVMEEFLISELSGAESIDSPISDAILTKLDLKQVIVPAGERNLDNFFAWLDQSEQEYVMYFPQTELELLFQDPELERQVLMNLNSLIAELPQCGTTETTVPEMLLERAPTNVRSLFPTCQSDKLEAEIVETNIKDFFAGLRKTDEVTLAIFEEVKMPKLDEETPMSKFISQLPPSGRSELITFLQTTEDVAGMSLLVGIGCLITAIIISLGAVFMGKLIWRRALLVFSVVFLLAGIITLLLSMLIREDPNYLLANIPNYLINKAELTTSMQAAVDLFHRKLFEIVFEFSLYAGGATTVVSFLLLLTSLLLPKTSAERRTQEPISKDLPTQDIAPRLKVGSDQHHVL